MSNFLSEPGEQKRAEGSENMPEQADAKDIGEAVDEAPDREEGSPVTGEWTVAALAHASVLLTLVLAFAGGIGALVGLLAPLMIYLSHRDRSRFIAFHALQSLVYQGLAIVVYVVLVAVLVGVVTVAWTISGLLSVVVIGFLLMPVALFVTGLMVILLLGIPLIWMGYGLYGAYQVYEGRNFRYWLLGEWLEREVRV